MPRTLMLVLVVAITAALTMAVIEFLPQTVFFPVVRLSAPGGLQVTFLQPGRADRAACEKIVTEIARGFGGNCPGCKLDHECVQNLSVDQRRALSREPIAQPSARMENGAMTVTFAAADVNFAMEACRQSEQQSMAQAANAHLRCFPAGRAPITGASAMALLPISGIDHINMCVTNLERSIIFYRDVFGFEVKEDHRDLKKFPWVNLGIPGVAYLVLYETDEAKTARDRRIIHFGFALKTAETMDALIARLAKAGVKAKTNRDGSPMVAHYEKSSSVYLSDPDGYELDISLRFGGGISGE